MTFDPIRLQTWEQDTLRVHASSLKLLKRCERRPMITNREVSVQENKSNCKGDPNNSKSGLYGINIFVGKEDSFFHPQVYCIAAVKGSG